MDNIFITLDGITYPVSLYQEAERYSYTLQHEADGVRIVAKSFLRDHTADEQKQIVRLLKSRFYTQKIYKVFDLIRASKRFVDIRIACYETAYTPGLGLRHWENERHNLFLVQSDINSVENRVKSIVSNITTYAKRSRGMDGYGIDFRFYNYNCTLWTSVDKVERSLGTCWLFGICDPIDAPEIYIYFDLAYKAGKVIDDLEGTVSSGKGFLLLKKPSDVLKYIILDNGIDCAYYVDRDKLLTV